MYGCVFQVDSSPHVFHLKFCMHFLPTPLVLHVPSKVSLFQLLTIGLYKALDDEYFLVFLF
jgi:hypothetical protein